ncbi:uncharacterized protein LOC131164727 isoform X2 [Malania oleifera]|uniref:uncharacterized protein LOC131164727 isoform X2 n=1 Tax=Malania oleifera TaxID=397392 RepID=UPI0025AE579F|nr:uncharacterized protein LOC131164727 isoform X2 [Malania oleifera]
MLPSAGQKTEDERRPGIVLLAVAEFQVSQVTLQRMQTDMAASSPALSNNSADTTTTSATTNATPTAPKTGATTAPKISPAAATVAAALQQRSETPKTQRGLNKPKCIKCGNVARSRCPFQSCKSCCSKAQNPCHIHDKTPSSSSPLFDQKSSEVSSSGTSNRVASLRQLSNNFSQFNNVLIPFRSRKPLTRKDAAAINEWRFSKLKEYKDRNIEAENEAFDRYMQNISLLEEVFSVKYEGPAGNGCSILNPKSTSVEDNGMKLKLRSSLVRTDSFRRKVQDIVDKGLMKLQKCELNIGKNDVNDQNEDSATPKKAKTWKADTTSVLNDLIDKLNKARSEEDLKSCLKIKFELFNQNTKGDQMETDDTGISEEQTEKNNMVPKQELHYSPSKLFKTTEIDQETLNSIDKHFNSLEQVEDL